MALSGCGYHATVPAAALPPQIHTIAIPAFQNHTTSYRVEQILTAAVVREFTTRTDFRIANSPAHADAVLRGDVLSTSISPLTYDSITGRLSSAEVNVSLSVSLTDSKGKVLYQNPSYTFHQQYEVSREPSSFFREESPAMDRLARDFAHTLVSDILENY